MDKKGPRTKTQINHMVAEELHINLQEATRLVSNAVRDGILTEVVARNPKKGRPPKMYIVVRSVSDIEAGEHL